MLTWASGAGGALLISDCGLPIGVGGGGGEFVLLLELALVAGLFFLLAVAGLRVPSTYSVKMASSC